jgi:hypothetical protein
MKHATAAGVIVLLCLGAPSAATAQRPTRATGFISLNVAMQEGPQRLALAVPVEIFGDTASLAIDDDIIGGTLFDVSAGLRGPRFAFGVGFSSTSVTDSHDFTAETLSPGGPGSFTRSVNGITPGLRHTERAILIFAAATRQVTERFDVMFTAGPTFFKVKQTVPTDITVSEPFGQVLQLPTATVSESAIGLHGSLDLNYMFHPRIGVGGLVRYAWGSVTLPNSTESMTLGGFQVGAGVRARF